MSMSYFDGERTISCGWRLHSWQRATMVLFMGLALAFAAHAAEDEGKESPEGKVELDLELPSPSYSGSPLNYESPMLEPNYWKKREAFYVPPNTKNVASGKPVTASAEPRFNELADIVDGDKSYKPDSVVELPAGPQWVQIDLQDTFDIQAILVWHFHESERVYFNMVVAVSDDPKFEDGVTVLYNNDYENVHGLGEGEDLQYVESHQGRLIDGKGTQARYVRLYSNGNDWDERNHYIEVEVYGTPAK